MEDIAYEQIFQFERLPISCVRLYQILRSARQKLHVGNFGGLGEAENSGFFLAVRDRLQRP
jgi:hypothetical protein